MPLIELETLIHAPIARVFDLSRSIDAHMASAEVTHERAIGGRTSGLIGEGETVIWEARHLGVKQRLTVRITSIDRPHAFEDEMVRGAFASMKHRHIFTTVDDATVMRDEFHFTAPFGFIGRKMFLTRYMTNFLQARNHALKELAEGSGWKRYLINIRDYEPADKDEVQNVSDAALPILRRIYRPGPKAVASRNALDTTLTRLVALADDKVVGTTEYYLEGDSLHLLGLMVHPAHHRKGVAKALVRQLADIAACSGRTSLRARTIRETGNVEIFERLGFSVISERSDDLFISDLHPSLTETDLELIL